MSAGLMFMASYTYSRSLDLGSGGNSSGSESRINIQNPRNLYADYGLSDFDHRDVFTLSPVYQLPFGNGRRFLSNAGRSEDALVGGWDLTGILTLESGSPFSVSMSSNASANTGTFVRPDRICNGTKSQKTLLAWYDMACFVTPAQYTFGNAGRNILTGPGLETLDLGLDKDFQIEGRFGLQFRSEFFNSLNHPNFGLPGNSIGSASAGKISSVITNARQIQFAVRLHW
jgi:hypothetical protein